MNEDDDILQEILQMNNKDDKIGMLLPETEPLFNTDLLSPPGDLMMSDPIPPIQPAPPLPVVHTKPTKPIKEKSKKRKKSSSSNKISIPLDVPYDFLSNTNSSPSLTRPHISRGSIKIYLKRISSSKCKLLRVDGLAPHEKLSGADSPLSPINFELPGLEMSIPSMEDRIRSLMEAAQIPSDLVLLRPIPSVKLVKESSRKSLDNVSLEDLAKAMEELQGVMRDAKKRGNMIKRRLEKLQPGIIRDRNFQQSAGLLEMIKDLDIKETCRAARMAHTLEATPVIADGNSGKGDGSSRMEEEKATTQQKKRDRKQRPHRQHNTPKSLWESWDSFWRYPDSAAVSNTLKPRPLPPFPDGLKLDAAFEIPELGPHYALSDQEKADFKLSMSKRGGSKSSWYPDVMDSSHRTNNLKHRLVCGLLSDSEMGISEKTTKKFAKEKRPNMDPAIRAVLSGLSQATMENDDGNHRVSKRIPSLNPLDTSWLAKAKSKTQAASEEERISMELHAIEILSPEVPIRKALTTDKESKIFIDLRDRQVRLYNEVKKNNEYRRKLGKLVAQAGVPMGVEADLTKIKEAYTELAKVYRAYKKKGLEATQFQVMKALSNLDHVKRQYGMRPELTGYVVDPSTVDGIPRYELENFMNEYLQRKERFEASHPHINIDREIAPVPGSKVDKRPIPERTNLLSRIEIIGQTEYASVDRIFGGGEGSSDDATGEYSETERDDRMR
mmetsp:Transcript_34274/g.82969  ORF Transcript_34274/g.82969 Transcript_34274/m.82969 type:complete len:724 (-) Transcript_34274:219-2390(-)